MKKGYEAKFLVQHHVNENKIENSPVRVVVVSEINYKNNNL